MRMPRFRGSHCVVRCNCWTRSSGDAELTESLEISSVYIFALCSVSVAVVWSCSKLLRPRAVQLHSDIVYQQQSRVNCVAHVAKSLQVGQF